MDFCGKTHTHTPESVTVEMISKRVSTPIWIVDVSEKGWWKLQNQRMSQNRSPMIAISHEFKDSIIGINQNVKKIIRFYWNWSNI